MYDFSFTDDPRITDYNNKVMELRLWLDNHCDDPNLVIADYNVYYICKTLDQAIALPRTTPTIAHTESHLIEWIPKKAMPYKISRGQPIITVDILAYLGTLPENKRDGIENNAHIWGS